MRGVSPWDLPEETSRYHLDPERVNAQLLKDQGWRREKKDEESEDNDPGGKTLLFSES